MLGKGFIGFITLLCAAHSAMAQSELPLVAVGTAYDRTDGEVLYSEHHFCARESNQCTVEYRDLQNETFARKQLDYSQSQQAPSLVLIDYRTNSQVVADPGEETAMVVDAGFDNYVRSIWSDLYAGELVRFPFLVVGIDNPVDMKATRTPQEACDSDELCLEISLDSWFLGLLIDPIELSYSVQDRRLLRFSGISNIKGDEGESLDVDILYEYYDTEILTGPISGEQTSFTF